MTDINTDDLFSEIKSSVQEKTGPAGLYSEILKLGTAAIGKKFLLRLVPYTKEGKEGFKKTFGHYIKYSWQQIDNDRWTSILSPRTNGGDCSISRYSYNIRNKGSKQEQDYLNEKLSYKEGWYVNAYIINDPLNPENNGTVKILNLGKKLYEYVQGALSGKLDESWTRMAKQYGQTGDINVGRKIFDLSGTGVNLEIDVRKNSGGFVDYTSSSFVYPDPSDPNQVFDADKRNEITEAAFDVTTVERVATDADNMAHFKRTFLGKAEEAKPQEVATPAATPAAAAIVVDQVVEAPVPQFVAPSDDNSAELDNELDEFLDNLSF